MNREPDYSDYTMQELLEARAGIDALRFAARAERLDEEINRRRNGAEDAGVPPPPPIQRKSLPAKRPRRRFWNITFAWIVNGVVFAWISAVLWGFTASFPLERLNEFDALTSEPLANRSQESLLLLLRATRQFFAPFAVALGLAAMAGGLALRARRRWSLWWLTGVSALAWLGMLSFFVLQRVLAARIEYKARVVDDTDFFRFFGTQTLALVLVLWLSKRWLRQSETEASQPEGQSVESVSSR
jgi:hypothetical protein